MAEKTVTTKVELEREYIIPLRNEWRKGANYERAGKAIKTIKKFIAKHMKVSDRDVSKVKLDQWLNQEVWFKGKKKPPARIKVRAIKESNGMVRVELAELPEFVKFEKAKKERRKRKKAIRRRFQRKRSQARIKITEAPDKSQRSGLPQNGSKEIIYNLLLFQISMRYNNINIIGSKKFQEQTVKALDLIKGKSKNDFNKIKKYLRKIKSAQISGMILEKAQFDVSNKNAFNSLEWYASAIVHDIHHYYLHTIKNLQIG